MEKLRNIRLFLSSINVINSTVYSVQIFPKLYSLSQLPEILILLLPRSESWLTQLKNLHRLFLVLPRICWRLFSCTTKNLSSSCFRYFISFKCFFFQVLLYGSCVSQKDNINKHACDKEFRALKACIRQTVSFLVDWSCSPFFLCLISLGTIMMLDFKPQTQLS